MAHYLFSYSSSISCVAPLHSLGRASRICRPPTAVLSCPDWHGDIVLTDRGTGKTVVLQALWLTLKHLNEDSFCPRSECGHYTKSGVKPRLSGGENVKRRIYRVLCYDNCIVLYDNIDLKDL